MSRCDQEMCSMWDGEGCPCAAFGIDRDDLPTSGVYTTTRPTRGCRACRRGDHDLCTGLDGPMTTGRWLGSVEARRIAPPATSSPTGVGVIE